jgi:hypothetical protein
MSLVTDNSKLVAPYDLDLFQSAPTDMSIMEMEEVPYRPVATFQPDGGDMRFEVPGNSEEFFKPSLTYMTFGLQIVNADGSNLPSTAHVGPVNNIAHTVFHSVYVTLGNQIVSAEPSYAYRAHSTALLTYGNDAKESHLSTSLFVKDTPGQMDTMRNIGADNQDEGNAGLNKRGSYFNRSKVVQCRIHLDCDIFNIDKFIPNQVDMKVSMTRSRPEFCLMAEPVAEVQPNFKIKIIDPILWVTKAKIFPPLAVIISGKLAQKEAKYNMTRCTVRPITIPTGIRSMSIDNVTTGQLPKRMFYGFVRNDAYDGAYGRNPFNYEHINLIQTSLHANGKSYPLTPFRPVYTGDNQNWVREYFSLFEALGIHHGNHGIGIHRDDYPNGYCLYGIDLSQNKRASSSRPVNLKKTGTTRIEFQLSVDLPHAYVCMVFCEYDNVMSIDNDRNVYVDYSV